MKENQENKPFGVIYMITNLINGKKYVGQTTRFKERIKAHFRPPTENAKKNGHISFIKRAISKYGEDNFEVVILKECLSAEDLNYWEKFYIKEYNTLRENGGYNLVNGPFVEVCKNKYSDDVRKDLGRSSQAKQMPSTSKYIGLLKSHLKFYTSIRVNGKTQFKSFDTEIEAAIMYDNISLFIHGPDARINFRENRENYLNKDLKSIYLEFMKPIEKNFKRKFKYIDEKDGGWYINLAAENKTGKRFCFGRLDSINEAAELVDKFMFLYNDSPIEDLNFPELAVNYKKENLEKEFIKYSCRSTRKTVKNGKIRGIHKGKISWIACIRHKRRNIAITTKNPSQEEAANSLRDYLSEFIKEKPNIEHLQHLKLTPPGRDFIINKYSIDIAIRARLEKEYELMNKLTQYIITDS